MQEAASIKNRLFTLQFICSLGSSSSPSNSEIDTKFIAVWTLSLIV